MRTKPTAGPNDCVRLRHTIQQIDDSNNDIPKEEQGSLGEVEVNHVLV